jgi:hypothetical protein
MADREDNALSRHGGEKFQVHDEQPGDPLANTSEISEDLVSPDRLTRSDLNRIEQLRFGKGLR